MKMRGEETECGFQYFLDFDFYEQEEKKEIDDLLFFETPETDNQRRL